MTTVTRPALRSLPLDDLAAEYDAGRVTFGELEAECARRDRAPEASPPKITPAESERAAWHDAAFSQYMAAEAATNGYLLSRAGLAAVTGPFALWRGPEAVAMRYASEELRAFWDDFPRLTVTEYRRGLAASRRDEQAAAEAERGTPPAAAALDPPPPERAVIPPMTPGAIARYTRALSGWADYADAMAIRLAATGGRLKGARS